MNDHKIVIDASLLPLLYYVQIYCALLRYYDVECMVVMCPSATVSDVVVARRVVVVDCCAIELVARCTDAGGADAIAI